MSSEIAYKNINYSPYGESGIRGMLISTRSGITLCSRGVERPYLMGGMICALTDLSRESMGQYPEIVETTDSKIAYSVDGGKIVMLVADRYMPSKTAKEIADSVSKRFDNRYDLSTFRGNVNEYEKFESEMEMIMYG